MLGFSVNHTKVIPHTHTRVTGLEGQISNPSLDLWSNKCADYEQQTRSSS